ncbi:hypothetical protein AVEN_97116-1 [Araneus ventricosus]|uniref:Uncharacterized protein n=1 Tax=Araneus ventricosus TaxID=182803 RepID=A0A4Y2SSA0_ARAVE|nr:hypothetical protein AVEN_97116-1 [Araneus ventricosus]
MRIRCSISCRLWFQERKDDRMVEGLSATAENCPKAIVQLKERFGRDDLLVQIFVRDLLSIVMKNAASCRTKTDLPALHDELEAKIRALESLGLTQENYSDFLTPLVECCLPLEILGEEQKYKRRVSS